MQQKEIKKGEIIIYKTPKGPQLDVKLKKQTLWLTQAQIASLFNIERSVITKHIKNIFESGELIEKSNVQKIHIANSDKPIKLYNLDLIISIGYRVNSKRATQFRIWATNTLKKCLIICRRLCGALVVFFAVLVSWIGDTLSFQNPLIYGLFLGNLFVSLIFLPKRKIVNL